VSQYTHHIQNTALTLLPNMENGGTFIIRTALLTTSPHEPEPEIVRSKDRALGKTVYEGLVLSDGPWAEDLDSRLGALKELRRLLGNGLSAPRSEVDAEGEGETKASEFPPSLPMPIKERVGKVNLRRILFAKRLKEKRGVTEVRPFFTFISCSRCLNSCRRCRGMHYLSLVSAIPTSSSSGECFRVLSRPLCTSYRRTSTHVR
jgi:hypothetical protein